MSTPIRFFFLLIILTLFCCINQRRGAELSVSGEAGTSGARKVA
jgi:hypothetical protein